MPSPAPCELLTPAEMTRADALAIAGGIPGPRLMLAAGRAVARAAQHRFPPGRTLVLAGPGNNGGDGYVAARLLEQAGWPVAVAALAPPRPGSDAALAAAAWRGPMAPFTPAEAARAALVVDAVFGAGLTRDLDGPAAETLAAVRAPLLAVDVPSGLDGATGQMRGFAPQAALTVTFFRLKPGHLLLPGRTLCGETRLADIGLPAAVLPGTRARAWRNAPGLWQLPAPGAAAHKYSRGHVTILGGAAMTGAARLAAGAAHRAGAGLVTIAAPDAASAALYRAGDPGTIVSEASLAALLEDARRRIWLLGPGLPPEPATRAALRLVIDAGRQVVADAGALVACAGVPAALAGAAVLTPHAGEFAKVFGEPGPDRPAAVRAAAARTGAVVLLKGADTTIAAPDGRLAINAHAPPWLATGGTGDVLAGIIAALLGQGMAPFEAACAATWLHGEAAFRHGPGLVAADLITLLPAALRAAGEA
ncbi:bifunctional NAD(P)H-hydrate repair enzyme [Siccirubricoccus deserti]|uniref:Bifunctional NAD(P)H-hydrate repair enzyme n=1 Tax=Siccirubricoccus deserti TaxID=2013562 RepID=A0A9X0UDL6_9PROT|nr:NAD(P)H-hydrate dehydratase [Siccirubricoccus deserti]MBC4016557.1 NAD(P)H-hydrate dehydratase [Siccirubricoccus deserti]GGC50027.1 bifunctional NAD(P)H-hydrate repair enzyme [Siccirubricoccus deserti]